MLKPYKNGLTIGKFMPFHKGHELMIDFGINMCETMNVLVSGREEDELPVSLRYMWVVDKYYPYPGLVVKSDFDEIPDPTFDENGTGVEDWFWDAWVNKIKTYFPDPIDAVFVNDQYGERLAKELGAVWIPIDPNRESIDISATKIRSDNNTYYNYLPDNVKKFYQKKIVIVGPESTGKSTMTKMLSDHFNAGYVHEYGRTLSEIRGSNMTEDDFRSIIAGHATLVNNVQELNRVVIVDTEAYTTYLFAEIYNVANDELRADILLQSHYKDDYDLYVLLAPTVKWVDDGIRVLPDQTVREKFFNDMKDYLDEKNRNYVIINDDNYETRLNNAIKCIDEVIKS